MSYCFWGDVETEECCSHKLSGANGSQCKTDEHGSPSATRLPNTPSEEALIPVGQQFDIAEMWIQANEPCIPLKGSIANLAVWLVIRKSGVDGAVRSPMVTVSVPERTVSLYIGSA
jgi:hypothetical protein